MRTTLQIDDDLLTVARSLAEAEGRSIGEIISRLARRGLEPRVRRSAPGQFPTFEVPAGAPPITPEMVKRADEATLP